MIRGQAAKKTRRCAANVGLHNRFDIEVIDGRTEEIREKAVGYNLILDALWTRIGTNARWFQAITYGSGSGTLTASRTELFTRVGAKAAGTLTADHTHFADGYVSFRQQIQIDAGELTGTTLTEVGIAYDTSANHLMTHALLKDMNGNTTSITIGEYDVVVIYATVFVRFSASGYEGGGVYFINIGNLGYQYGMLYAIAGCAAYVTGTAGYWNVISVYAGRPYEPVVKSIALYDKQYGYIDKKTGLASYDSASKKIYSKFSLAAGSAYRIGVSELNPATPGGWNGAMLFNGVVHSGLCVTFPNNAKPYCQITNEAVATGDGTTLDFPLDFGFILNDGTAVIKVDGVTINSEYYSLDFGKPANGSIGYFMRSVDAVVNGGGVIYLGYTSTTTIAAGDYQILENPLYESFGITSFYRAAGLQVDVSNDLENWTEVCNASVAAGTFTVPTAQKNFRYWKVSAPSGIAAYSKTFYDLASTDLTTTHLHFAAGHAPADGGAITATYRTESICKDTNHVVDLEIEISLQEYTP